MASSSEHFCLRWNDFESNISHAFREIRDEKDFFDVTLACEDEQIQAHKVILSACSPFFRTILRRNRHDHPLLYLKGVKYTEVISILNFMYHGEVNVAQEELNSFLSVAEDLRVKGLTLSPQDAAKVPTNNQHLSKAPMFRTVREPPDISASPSVKKARLPSTSQSPNPSASISTPVKTEPMAAPDVMEESYSDARMATSSSKHDLTSYEDPNNYDYSAYEEEEPSVAQFDASNSHTLRPEGNKEMAKFVLSHLDEGVDEDGKRQFTCRLCQFSSERKEKVRQHIESWHGDELGIRYRCDFCEKAYKCHSNLRSHVSATHKHVWSHN